MPWSVVTVLLAAIAVVPAQAQRFGGTAAITRGELFVAETRNRAWPGEVYVYAAQPEWRTITRFRAPDATGDPDGFGRSVSADGGMVLVGASGNADTKGAAFVYEKDAGGSWAAATALEAEGNIAGDAFGASVLMHGSVALVAAPRAGEGAGLVYAFEHDAQDSFTLSSRLRGSDSEEGDMFGSSLLMAGEMMAIGAPLRNGGRGAVYVFHRDDAGIWQQSAKIEVDDLPERSAFGSALYADDASLYVGAPGVDQRTGAVFQFAFDDAAQVWREAGRLTAFESDRFVQFGAALAMDGEDLWVGAPGAANGTGRIYRYVRGAFGWLGVATLMPESAGERASFGSAVAINGSSPFC